METKLEKVERLVRAQQAALKPYDAAHQVGEQLLDLARADARCAELLASDLETAGMSIRDAEKKIKARADEIHKETHASAVCVPVREAYAILAKFYYLPEGCQNVLAAVAAGAPVEAVKADEGGQAEAEDDALIDLDAFL